MTVHVLERRQRLALPAARAFEFLPFGVLGRVAHALFVRRDLERIFDYRRHAVAEALR